MGLTININYCRKGGREKCARKMNGAETRAPHRSPSTRDAAAFEAAAAEEKKLEEENSLLIVITLCFLALRGCSQLDWARRSPVFLSFPIFNS